MGEPAIDSIPLRSRNSDDSERSEVEDEEDVQQEMADFFWQLSEEKTVVVTSMMQQTERQEVQRQPQIGREEEQLPRTWSIALWA